MTGWRVWRVLRSGRTSPSRGWRGNVPTRSSTRSETAKTGGGGALLERPASKCRLWHQKSLYFRDFAVSDAFRSPPVRPFKIPEFPRKNGVFRGTHCWNAVGTEVVDMAIFLRGNTWWFEYRTRHERVVRTTGFKREDRAKAQAVLDAFRLARGTKPKRSVVEGLLEAIYAEHHAESGVPLSSVWTVYQDWMKGKGRVVAPKTVVERRGLVSRFVEWAAGRGRSRVDEVDVSLARAYVAHMRELGRSNKTLRNSSEILSGIWTAIGQLVPGVHNPWQAARPDNDGSSVRREAFSVEEEARVLEAAKKVGHGWWLASVISRWTGQRYGDVAQLDWSAVDLKARTIAFTPSKTKRHDLRLLIPMSKQLHAVLLKIPVSDREGFVVPEHGVTYPLPFEPPFSSVLKAAGLDDGRFTFHSWRHTFRTRLGDAGVPDSVAMRFGWTNLSMSRHYDHAQHLPEMRDAVDRLH